MADKKYLLEYSAWLEAELTRRYRTSQTMEGKRKGRNALSDTEGGGFSREYNGMFKVIWDNVVDDAGNVTQRRVKVIDGANPENGFAGYYDIGAFKQVSNATIEITEKDTAVFLIIWHNGTYYQHVISCNNELPEGASGNFASYLLASINTNEWRISQAWMGGTIYVGERYFI